MPVTNLHFLNARLDLTLIMSDIRAAVREAVDIAAEHADLPDFDVVIRSGERVITGWGVAGYAPAPGEVQITIDPPRFDAAALQRTLIHEIHHVIRWDGPGYGSSLGEALVTEGLAGHFVRQVLGGKPDPWDAVTPAPGLTRRAMNEWSQLGYDHAAWFLGGSKTIRRWTGYGLGHRLLAAFLERNPDEDAVTLATMPADHFRATMRMLAKSDGETVRAEAEDAPEAAPDAGVTPGGEQPTAEAQRGESGTG
ncbi:DUF2268 domain-containing putative Zn-dependent protease [Paracoccus isoporae]|nr:DUF2268 domain-containing putative Zn-dependent protease [Paracoccus isoporae]